LAGRPIGGLQKKGIKAVSIGGPSVALSRFIYVGNNKTFYHAGGDLPSIKGQSIVLEQAEQA
jgi:hypothetical protein